MIKRIVPFQTESSTSTSHVSTPNQATNISTTEVHDTNVNGQSTPCNAPGKTM